MTRKKRGTALSVALAVAIALVPWLPAKAQEGAIADDGGLGYIVKFREDAAMPMRAGGLGESLGLGMYRVADEAAVTRLADAGALEFAEPNYIYTLFDGDLVDDQYYSEGYQWDLDFMDIGPLWSLGDHGLSGQGVVVAVVDSGLAPHEDLPQARMLTGYNAVDKTDNTYDIDGHGTFVSGIIAAQADNTVGVAGVAPGASILPCMAFQDTKPSTGVAGIGATAADLIDAVTWATDHGADVINMSLGSTSPSYAMQEAIDYAVSHGVIVVAATGNDRSAILNYPAASRDVIGVGALGEVSNMNDTSGAYKLKAEGKGNWAQYSNYNASVFVTAPGTELYSTVMSWGVTSNLYGGQSGTSCATPCVAGLAALAKEYDRSIDAHQFQNLLALTAEDRGEPGRDDKYGYGSVNAANMAAALPQRRISYDLNGGAWQEAPSAAQTAFKTYQSESVTLPVPVREGYAFMGWYRAADLSGAPEEAMALPALEDDVTYTAKWLDDDKALAAVTYTLDGVDYAVPLDEGESYRLYLPYGTDLTGGVLTAQAASATTEVYLLRSDTDPGRWTVRATPASGRAKTYPVTIDCSRHAPGLAPGQTTTVTATATPGSLDGSVAARSYTADLSTWFTDPDSPQLTYSLGEVTLDGQSAAPPTLTLTGSSLRFIPGSVDEGKTLRFTVSASDGQFDGPPVAVTVTVGTIPDDLPPVTPTPTPTPTATPTLPPTATPTASPSASPTAEPTATPTASPSASPTAEPTATPTASPSASPTAEPTATPTASPSASPTAEPTASPSASPTAEPTPTPTASPSPSPSATAAPSPSPSHSTSPSSRPSGGGGSYSRPSSASASSAPPATPADPVPAAVTAGAEGTTLELKEDRSLTQSERQTVLSANADGPVTVHSPGLRVVIPRGTVRTEEQVADLLADVSQARAGDTIVRTDAQGQRHPVPLSVVSGGRAAYVADRVGRYSLMRGGATFSDTQDHWAREAINFSAARELVRGMSQDCFDPERPATRAMVFTLLARLEGASLPPVQDGAWYDSAVDWAVSCGLSDGTRPQGAVKREELVTLLWRWSGQPKAQTELMGFTDLWTVSPYAREPMAWAVENGILTGRMDASLDPAAGATRAETAVILQRFITYQVDQPLGE